MRRWLIAAGFYLVWLLVMLAGSDIPPPFGFVWIPIGLAVICAGVALAMPWLWRVRAEQGLSAVVWRTTMIGALVGTFLAGIFAVRGSGEPSIPPMDLSDYLIWFSVVMVVGAVNGIVVGLVVSWLRPSLPR